MIVYHYSRERKNLWSLDEFITETIQFYQQCTKNSKIISIEKKDFIHIHDQDNE